MSWAVARNLQTTHIELITLMRSLKTAWDFSADKNDEKDILKVSCRFDENAKKVDLQQPILVTTMLKIIGF